MDELCIREAVKAYASHYSYEAIGQRFGINRNTPLYHIWNNITAYSGKLKKRRYRVILEEAKDET